MLFLDNADIVTSRNIKRHLNQPQRPGPDPIITPEYPWEGVGDQGIEGGVYFYGSVLHEDGKFRMWYNCIGNSKKTQRTAYAESTDGVHFVKQLSADRPAGGLPESNVVFGKNVNTHGPSVIRDDVTDDPNKRYRIFFDSYLRFHQGLVVPPEMAPAGITQEIHNVVDDWRPPLHRAQFSAASPDGIHWGDEECSLARVGQSDIGQSVLWDPDAKLFRAYIRENEDDMYKHRVRTVHMLTSPDFEQWTPSREVFRPDVLDGPPQTQIYGISVTRHHGLFIGIIQVFEVDEIIDGGERGFFHAQLIVSRDGENFERVADRAPFIQVGPEGSWEGGMIRVGSNFVSANDKMWFYYDGRNAHHMHVPEKDGPLVSGIGVATLPLDRFMALMPNDVSSPAEVVVRLNPTVPLTPHINVETGDDGQVSYALSSETGTELQGFGYDDCAPVTGDGLRAPLTWSGGNTLPANITDASILLRLRLEKGAQLYAVYAKSRDLVHNS